MPNKTNRLNFRLYDFIRVKMEQQKRKWKITLINKLENQDQTVKRMKPPETKKLINFIFDSLVNHQSDNAKQMEKIINLIKNHA